MVLWARFNCKCCGEVFIFPYLVDEDGVHKLYDHAKSCGADVTYEDFGPRDHYNVICFDVE